VLNKNEALQERIAIKMYHGNISRQSANRQAMCEIYPMSDDDVMPFGKYKGARLADVPVYYFHFLYVEGKADDLECPVGEYIRRNLQALEKEKPDLIWVKKDK